MVGLLRPRLRQFGGVCASTRDELPVDGEMDPELYFNLFQSHAYWPIVAEEYDRRLDALPFPGGVYVVNHAQNLSFRLQRKGQRTENIIRSIAEHRIEDATPCARISAWTS